MVVRGGHPTLLVMPVLQRHLLIHPQVDPVQGWTTILDREAVGQKHLAGLGVHLVHLVQALNWLHLCLVPGGWVTSAWRPGVASISCERSCTMTLYRGPLREVPHLRMLFRFGKMAGGRPK